MGINKKYKRIGYVIRFRGKSKYPWQYNNKICPKHYLEAKAKKLIEYFGKANVELFPVFRETK